MSSENEQSEAETSSTDERPFDDLLEYLRRTRGFDFSAYKRPSLKRRVQKRVGMLSLAGFDHYVDYLEVHPDEFPALFNTILINVTAFFRDEPAWDMLRTTVIPPCAEASARLGDVSGTMPTFARTRPSEAVSPRSR